MNGKNTCPYHPSIAGDGTLSDEWGETRKCSYITDHWGAVEDDEKRYCKTERHPACTIFRRKKLTEEGKREEFVPELKRRGEYGDGSGTFVREGPWDGVY